MADKTSNTLKLLALVCGLLLAIVSPIVTVAIAREQDKAARQTALIQIEASQDAAKASQKAALEQMNSSLLETSRKADKATAKSQENAEDLEYFKGKIEGTLTGVQKSMENMAANQRDASGRYDKRVDKVESKIDELLKIMVRFKRAGDGE